MTVVIDGKLGLVEQVGIFRANEGTVVVK